MKFDELDKKMRVFETNNDMCVLPKIFMVARIDGRCFTRLTKEVHKFEAPYDPVFRDYMIETTKHLMECGFQVVYGYTQSDEISLVLGRDDDSFGRKLRKINSILAGEASAKFSLLLKDMGTFDCRISQLPTIELVADYLRWRNEDACRNALNSHCYWTLRRQDKNANEATKILSGFSVAEKNELLFTEAGINFNDIPMWQKRGIGFYWEDYEKESINPVTQEKVTCVRRRVKVDMELPMRDAYGEFVLEIISEATV